MKKLCRAKARTHGHQLCRRIAMANGRCRLHGGLSTGPKTKKGREKARLAVLKHGFYTQAAMEERAFLRTVFYQGREQIKLLISNKAKY